MDAQALATLRANVPHKPFNELVSLDVTIEPLAFNALRISLNNWLGSP